MNILVLCLSSGLGGLELYAYRSARGLSKNHHVKAIARDKLLKYFRDNSDIDTTEEKCTFKALPVFTALRVAKYIDSNDIDIIYAHWVKDIPLAVLSKLFSRKRPRLVFMRQMKITRGKSDIYHRFLYRNIDLMLTITNQLSGDCMKYIGTNVTGGIETLYLGVAEPESFLSAEDKDKNRKEFGLDTNDFVVGLFGRLEKNKGQHLLINAIALAKENGIAIKALIVGHEMEQGYRNQLVDLAESLDISDQVIFSDFLNNPQAIMQLCDCVALTTTEETFGLVLPEAMRAGIAVIGSNRGGVLEIIDHEKTGLLFESEDPDSLCEQIITLYKDPDLRKTLSEKGKIKADSDFNEIKHISILEQYLTSTLQQ